MAANSAAFCVLLLVWAVLASISLGTERDGLAGCLNNGIGNVILAGDDHYEDAKQCINLRPDIIPNPLAIAHVKTVAEVQTAVRCAARFGVQACARAGGHGFDNGAGCTGGVVVDVRELQSFAVDGGTNRTTFGAGHCLGQLYFKLDRHGLLVPGGAVSGVGAAGLILGCGRGLTTQQHGLACDVLEAVEYVDAAGAIRTADAATAPDVFWMARGGGGNFPGIVTKFTMRTFARPDEVYVAHCIFAAQDAKRAAKAWLARGSELVDPARKLFTSLQMWNRPAFVEVYMYCFDCLPGEKQWMDSTMRAIAEGAGSARCDMPKTRTWLDQILYESGYYHGQFTTPAGKRKEEGLLDCTNGWGSRGPYRASKNGGHMGNDWSVSNGLLDDVLELTHRNVPQQDYGLMIEWYLTGGPKVREVPHSSTAYGHRSANWVLHYKHQWVPSDHAMMEAMMEHHLAVSRAIDRHLPCRNFYNYIDSNMTCAATNDAWLRAHFSDVTRMRAAKALADPANVFRSRLAPDMATVSPTTAAPTDQGHKLLEFAIISEGSCADAGLFPITAKGLCEAAARELQLADRNAKRTDDASRPEGCYILSTAQATWLWMGMNPMSKGRGTQVSHDVARRPICSSRPHFERLSEGSCSAAGLFPITHRATCEAAARELQLTDTQAKSTEEAARPEGCYYYGGAWLYMGLSPLSRGRGAETSEPGRAREPICSVLRDDLELLEAPVPHTSAGRRRRRRVDGQHALLVQGVSRE